MLTHTPRWSHAPGNQVVPSRWQATSKYQARPGARRGDLDKLDHPVTRVVEPVEATAPARRHPQPRRSTYRKGPYPDPKTCKRPTGTSKYHVRPARGVVISTASITRSPDHPVTRSPGCPRTGYLVCAESACGAVSPEAVSNGKWHATNRPGATSANGGGCSAQTSCAYGQRVRKGHPDGLSTGFGTSPVSSIRSRGTVSSSATSGAADSSASVYG